MSLKDSLSYEVFLGREGHFFLVIQKKMAGFLCPPAVRGNRDLKDLAPWQNQRTRKRRRKNQGLKNPCPKNVISQHTQTGENPPPCNTLGDLRLFLPAF